MTIRLSQALPGRLPPGHAATNARLGAAPGSVRRYPLPAPGMPWQATTAAISSPRQFFMRPLPGNRLKRIKQPLSQAGGPRQGTGREPAGNVKIVSGRSDGRLWVVLWPPADSYLAFSGQFLGSGTNNVKVTFRS